MADEITLTCKLQVTNGAINANFGGTPIRMDQSAPAAWVSEQNIGTSEEVLSLAGVASPKAVIVQNIDDTNYVDWGPELTGAMVAIGRLYPDEISTITLKPGVVIRMQADTAAVNVRYMVV